jgi:membrane associated rhomboid family serine protease
MWTLYIFGDNVEDRMGSARYAVFYLLAGLAAGLVQVYFARTSTIPTVGASGAIAGVLGAYFLLFPNSRVTTLILLFFLPWFVEIPAVFFLGLWFLSQLSSGLMALGAAGSFGGIAWWAHVGGFIFGLVAVHLFARRPMGLYPQTSQRRPSVEYIPMPYVPRPRSPAGPRPGSG